jgi:hypothetical protein
VEDANGRLYILEGYLHIIEWKRKEANEHEI